MPAPVRAATLRPTMFTTRKHSIGRADGSRKEVLVTLRIDTPIEIDYYQAGGILPFVLGQLIEV